MGIEYAIVLELGLIFKFNITGNVVKLNRDDKNTRDDRFANDRR